MAKDSARRAWVKNVAIIFLVILLLLTFFSNTILNYSLPEVSAQYPRYASLTTSVKATGTVKANESYNVVYEADAAEADDGLLQSRRVVSVYVKAGDYVSIGSPILSLKGGASDQLSSVQAEYESLKKEYELALLGDTVTELTAQKTISDARDAVTDAKTELAVLEAEYSALLNENGSSTELERQIEGMEAEIALLDDQIAALENTISDVKSKIAQAEGMIEEDILSTTTLEQKLAMAEYDFADAEYRYESLKKREESLKKQVEKLTAAAEDVTEANALSAQLTSLEKQLTSMEKQELRAYEDYLNQRGALEEELDALKPQSAETETGAAAVEPESTSDNTAQIEALEKQIAALEKSYLRSHEDLTEQMEELKDQIREVISKLNILGMPEVDDVLDYAVAQELEEARKQHSKVSDDLTEAETAYNTAKTKVESLRKQMTAEGVAQSWEAVLVEYENEMDVLEGEKKAKNKELERLKNQESASGSFKTPDEVKKAIEEKQNTVSELETQLKITEATQAQSSTRTKQERESQKSRLTKLEEKIASYQNAPENTDVTAPIAGRVVAVNYLPGDTVTSGNTVASIEIADRGYVCEISMPAEESRNIQVGTSCTVVNNWMYSNVSASIVQVRTDPTSQGRNRIIKIEVTGDNVYEGLSLTFSMGEKNQSYDSILPNSAIRQDNEGTFVLVVESKKTPLNIRYTAKRVDVTVIASDNTQSAVSGLAGGEFVITNSDTPISDGQPVRLAET